MEALRRSGQIASSSCRCITVGNKRASRLPFHKRNSLTVRMRAGWSDEDDDVNGLDTLEKRQQFAEIWNEEQYMGDNSYLINNKYNQEPNYDDPEWHKKVTDWGEFWNYQKWDMEIEGLDDEHDVAGNPINSPERVMKLFSAIKDMRYRSDVKQWMGPDNFRENLSVWENPPVAPDLLPVNPAYTNSDLRAISEKRRRKDIMDIEWRRRQSLVGLLTYPNPYQLDERLIKFGLDVTDLDWTEEETYKLITLDGLAAKPEAHQAHVENPLVPIDYVTTMGVSHIEETEDFIESIGHMADPREEEDFEAEVLLDAMAFVGWTGEDLVEDLLAYEEGTEQHEQDELRQEEEEEEEWEYDGDGDVVEEMGEEGEEEEGEEDEGGMEGEGEDEDEVVGEDEGGA